MKKNYLFYLASIMISACMVFASCGDDEDEVTLDINPAGVYIGTTYTNLNSRGTDISIDTTYNQPITIRENHQGQLELVYHNWTDHQNINYGDFTIVPLTVTKKANGVALSGECTDSLYKGERGFLATLSAEGTIIGEEKAAALKLKIDLPVTPAMTLKFALTYNGIAQ